MPVTVQTRVNRSSGNGVTTVFPYNYRILDKTHILVTVDGVTKTVDVDYAVSGVGDAGGGNITFVVAPANLSSVIRRSSAPYARATDYVRNGSFQEETVDADFDLAVIQIQQLAEVLGRALTVPVDDGASANVEYPVAAFRAGKLAGFDEDGNATVYFAADVDLTLVTPFIKTLCDDENGEEARGTLGSGAIGDAIFAAETGEEVKGLLELDGDYLETADIGVSAQPYSESTMRLLYGEAGQALNANIVASLANIAGTWTLTIALKTFAGSDPSPADPVFVTVPTPGATNGEVTLVKITVAMSIAVTHAGSTPLHDQRVFIGIVWNVTDGARLFACQPSYTQNPVGTNFLSSRYVPPANGIQISAGLALNGSAGHAVSSVSYAASDGGSTYLAVVEIINATSGFANGTISTLRRFAALNVAPNTILGREKIVMDASGGYTATNIIIPSDNTIPQITEGVSWAGPSISRVSRSSYIRIRAHVHVASSVAGTLTMALFRAATSDAIAATAVVVAANEMVELIIDHIDLWETTGATNYEIRVGASAAGTLTFEGFGGAFKFAGVLNSGFTVEEISL